MVRRKQILKSWQRLNSTFLGRSVASCMGVWHHLQANIQARFTAPVQSMVNFQQAFPQNASKARKRRPASGESGPSAVDRVIQPQLPFNFPPVNSPSVPTTDQGTAAAILGGPPKKKRGRPSKLEYEAKVAEAAARGEEYHPTPKRKKVQRASLQGTPNASMAPPSMTEIEAAGDGSAGQENVRHPKAAFGEGSGPVSESIARSLNLEATALAADQMQIDEKRPFKNSIQEKQASGIEARSSLLADVGEGIDPHAPDTIQNTRTLQYDSTPHNNFTSYQSPSRGPVTAG